MANSFDEIRSQMANHGIIVPDNHDLHVTNDQYERFRPVGEKKKKKTAWYRIYQNVTNSGKVYFGGSFGIRSDQWLIVQNKASQKQLTEEELKEIRESQRKAKERVELEKKKDAEEAAAKAARVWKLARREVSIDQPYIAKKKIKPYVARQLNNTLVVPMYLDRKMIGAQTITTDKETGETDKRFIFRQTTIGAYCPIGQITDPINKTLYVCEGFATGCSIHEATGQMVLVAFNAGNVSNVVKSARAHWPDAKIIIAGDNDHQVRQRAIDQLKNAIGIDAAVDEKQEIHTYEKDGKSFRYVMYSHVVDEIEEVSGYYVAYNEKSKREEQIPINKRNTGAIAARVAARKYGCCVVLPQFKNKDTSGTDFNDLANEEGLTEARAQLTNPTLKPIAAPASGSSTNETSGTTPTITDELNGRYVCIVGSDSFYDRKINRFVKQKAMENEYCPQMIKDWLKRLDRTVIMPEQLVFEPSGSVPAGYINAFTGWAMKPAKTGSCARIIEHIYETLCGGNTATFDWVMRWLAYPLQHPGAKMHTALVLRGKQGTGKSIFFEHVIKPIYEGYTITIDQRHLESSYTDWMSRKLFILAEEVLTSQERRRQKALIKTWITSKDHTIMEKFMDSRTEENRTNFVFLSNELQPLQLEESDRRFMVLEVQYKPEKQYFIDLMSEIQNGGVESFYNYLLTFDLSDFNPDTPIIETEAHTKLVNLGKSAGARFIDALINKDTAFTHIGPARGLDLYSAYRLWATMSGEKYTENQTAFLMELSEKMQRKRKRIKLFQADKTANEASPSVEKQAWVYYPPCECDLEEDMNVALFEKEVREAQEAAHSRGAYGIRQ